MSSLSARQIADLEAYLDEELADLRLPPEEVATLRRRIFRVAEEWTVERSLESRRPAPPYLRKVEPVA